jgi:hypothetical protein
MLMMAMLMAAAPIQIEPGKSIAKVSVGMSRAEVAKLHKLKSDGIDRAERTGFVSGPLYFLFNAQDVVVLVGVELQKSGGVRIGKVQVPARISAEDFVKRVPNCTLSDGSGGHAISCGDGLNAYDSWGGKYVEAIHLVAG